MRLEPATTGATVSYSRITALLACALLSIATVRGILAADEPPEPKPADAPAKQTDEPAKTDGKSQPLTLTIEGEVDADLAPVAGQMTKLFYEGYPNLIRRFEKSDRPAPRNVRVVFVKGLRVPAQCSGNKVEVSVDWLRKHPEDTALLIHELTHAVQRYPRGVTGWMTEGVADYARQEYGPKDQPGWSLPKKLTVKQSYKDSYRTTARFLVWLEARTPGSVDKLHKALQQGTFTIEDFQAVAGRPVDALWDECVKELSK
jgi:hypothetical protein